MSFSAAGPRRIRQAASAVLLTTATAGAVILAARVLWWAGGEGLGFVGSGHATLDQAIGAAAAVVGLGCLAWFGLAIAATVLAAAPGRVGALSAAISDCITPVVVRRLVTAAIGISITAASAGTAQAATWAAAPVPTAPPPATTAPLSWFPPPSLDRPSTPLPPQSPPQSPQQSPPPTPARAVLVAPGDCLWSIAAAELGPGASGDAIDVEWRRWYAANRDVIGPDPDLIQPGQRLVAPAPTH